jgi:hypothetical protein
VLLLLLLPTAAACTALGAGVLEAVRQGLVLVLVVVLLVVLQLRQQVSLVCSRW